jgi:YbgC/YbaW family acyl-CoA thioester hydrolase
MTEPTAPERQHFRFFDRLRVRWAEVDMQKIVFNGHYLMYFDTAVAAYWRALALPYHDTMEALQGDLYVRKATLEYEASARYDDACDVGMRCARIGKSSMLFQAAVFRGEQRLVHGELVYVFADPSSQTSRPVPQTLRDTLEAFEAGEPMLRMCWGSWQEWGPEISRLREPEAARPDADDALALHLLARNRLGVAVGAARVLAQPAGQVSLGCMSVLHAVRGAGAGREMLAAVLAQARQQGVVELRLLTPSHIVPFFARAGFIAEAAERSQSVPMRLMLA